MSRNRSSRWASVGVVVLAALWACGGTDDDRTADGDPSVASGDSRVGGTVSVLGVLGGENLEAFLAAFEPFEQQTGIAIEYEGTQDLLAVLQTRLDGGNPPDIVSNPSAGQMQSLAADGELVPLDDIVDVEALEADFPSALVELASADHSTYGIPGTTAVAGLVWYNPNEYEGPTSGSLEDLEAWADEAADDGRTPYCIGLESGPVSGWPGASWIQQYMLQQSGADAYNAWWQGELAWSSPEVTRAFESFGAHVTDPSHLSGGPTAALTTSFSDSGIGLFGDPPACYLHVQADWLGSAMVATVPDIEPVTDIDFFPFPSAREGVEPGVVTSGETFGAFRDTPQTRAFMTYVASPEFSARIAASGLWIGPNRQTPPSAYTSELSRKAAELLANAETVVFGAQDGMPAEMVAAFHQAVMSFVAEPERLDDILDELDHVQEAAYADA